MGSGVVIEHTRAERLRKAMAAEEGSRALLERAKDRDDETSVAQRWYAGLLISLANELRNEAERMAARLDEDEGEG